MAKKRVRGKNIKKFSEKNKDVPSLVKVISVLFYISAFASFIFALILIIGGIAGSTSIEEFIRINIISGEESNSWFVEAVLASLIVGGVIVLLFSVLDFFVARGLWKGQKWARILVIVFMILSFLSSLFSLDVVGIILTGLIGSYLWFDKSVKKAFGK